MGGFLVSRRQGTQPSPAFTLGGILAGCNSLMTGNYLTTAGRNTKLDLEMIEDLGLVCDFDVF